MSDETYMAKENAKQALVTALIDYKIAAEEDGLDEDQMIEEIEIAISDAEFGEVVVEKESG